MEQKSADRIRTGQFAIYGKLSLCVNPAKLHQQFIETREKHPISLETDLEWVPGEEQQTPKFMQTLDDFIYKELEKIAKKRGITIQELIRAVIVPEWINGQSGNGSTGANSDVAKDPSARVNNWR